MLELETVPAPLAPTRTHQRVNRSNKNQKWSTEDDEKLTQLVNTGDPLDWGAIAQEFPTKTQQQVMERWNKVINPALTKGSWTGQEDQIIMQFVAQYGKKSWSKLAEKLPGRIGKQCRERWINHLDPDMSHGPFTPEEDKLIIELHQEHGNKWAKIAACMPRRTCNAIKNRWNSTLVKLAPYEPKVGTMNDRLVLTPVTHIDIEPVIAFGNPPLPLVLRMDIKPDILPMTGDAFGVDIKQGLLYIPQTDDVIEVKPSET